MAEDIGQFCIQRKLPQISFAIVAFLSVQFHQNSANLFQEIAALLH